MEIGRKLVTLYIAKNSWMKTKMESVLTLELLPEGRMRIVRRVGIGMKGLPEIIVKDHSLRDGPVEIEVLRNDKGDAAMEVYVSQIEELAAGGTVWVVSTIRDRLVFSGKSDRGVMARELVNQAMAALGTHPRTSSSFIPAERICAGELDDDAIVPPRKRARTTT